MKSIFAYLAAAWLLEICDETLLGGALDYFGIWPHRLDAIGLSGIFFSPFLHGSFQHLYGNTLGYIPLAVLVWLKNYRKFNGVFWLIAILEGLGVWAIGKPGTIHIGMSGVIFGLFGFLAVSSLFRLDLLSLMASGFVLLFYERVQFGINPILSLFRISWEGHLMGLVAGCLAGYLRSLSSTWK